MDHQFAAKDNSFGHAADGAEIGKRALGQGALQDGAIAGVAFGHAENKGVSGQCGDQIGGLGVDDDLKVAGLGQALEPVFARVNDRNGARQREQDGHQGLNDVAGAEDNNGPRASGCVGLEVEFHRAAAGHADVALEAPVDEAWRRGGGGEEFLRERDGLRFDAAAADGAGEQAGGRDDHFGSGVLRRAAERIDQDDENKGRGIALKGGELFVERRHF